MPETATRTRAGVDLVISYGQNPQKFNGTVTNTNDTAVNDVRESPLSPQVDDDSDGAGSAPRVNEMRGVHTRS